MELLGQDRALSLLQKLMQEKASGRTFILLGNRGCGKFTAALRYAREVLGRNPFLSSDFLFYRNDDYSLKSRFFLQNKDNPKIQKILSDYFFYLMGRLSMSLSLGEIAKTAVKLKKLKKSSESNSINDFRNDLEEILLNNKLAQELSGNPAFADNIIAVSDELSKKKRIPIDFIRSTIAFHSRKSPGAVKLSVISNFENATEEAQNASLKLFEEPSNESLIVLTADSTDRILPTILSRSIVIHMDPLSAGALKDILGMENTRGFHSTVDLMEDCVYHYKARRQDRILDFFRNVAPKVQHGNELFRFIEELTDDDNNRLPELFLEELIEFFRLLNLQRQAALRNITLPTQEDQVYGDLIPHLIRESNTAELKDMANDVSEVLRGMHSSNITPGTVLPALLINISRWYQRRWR